MIGYIIDYESKDRKSLVHIHMILFGRLNKQTHKGRKYVYYQKGFLHDKLYIKLSKSKYFVKGDCNEDEEVFQKIKSNSNFFKIFKNIELSELFEEKTEEELDFITAKVHWQRLAKEKEYRVKNFENGEK